MLKKITLSRPFAADIVWLLFLMKDMKNLDLASSKLAAVEKGFRKAHGEGLQRLTTLKGEYCAEKLLYVRLHLLQVCAVPSLTLMLNVACTPNRCESFVSALSLLRDFLSWCCFVFVASSLSVRKRFVR